jgi:DNA mismatch endonuclease (patch repair protein)
MSSIRSKDTRPERRLRRALWQRGVRGWRCHWKGPAGQVDIAFTRWKLAIYVDGSFWHGHPSKWQPGRWTGYWDTKIKRNIERDERGNATLVAAGWRVLRFWDFQIEQDADSVVAVVEEALIELRES